VIAFSHGRSIDHSSVFVGTLVGVPPHLEHVRKVGEGQVMPALSPNGRWLATTDGFKIIVTALTSGRVVNQFAVLTPSGLSWSDNQTLLVASSAGIISRSALLPHAPIGRIAGDSFSASPVQTEAGVVFASAGALFLARAGHKKLIAAVGRTWLDSPAAARVSPCIFAVESRLLGDSVVDAGPPHLVSIASRAGRKWAVRRTRYDDMTILAAAVAPSSDPCALARASRRH
jgi:hypothetical protein